MAKTAFIFPGQGSQFIGMGKDLYHTFLEAREVFQEVDEILKQDLSKLMFEGELEDLTHTYNTQPALMAVSVAALRVLEKQGGVKTVKPDYLAGHSLGEYSALCAGKAIGLADTAQVLRARGEAMHNAARHENGAMLALLGATEESALSLANESKAHGVCQIANDNGAGQFVLSGLETAITHAAQVFANHNIKRAIKLNVSGAFHSELMKPAERELKAALDKVQLNNLTIPLVANFTAKPVLEGAEIKDLLVSQVSGTVKWRQSVEFMLEQGAARFVEIGAGKVLTTLVKRMNDSVEVFNIQTPEEIEKFLAVI